MKDLRDVVAQLRGPEGCPWDKEQTALTLTPYALEEVFELVEAIERGDDNNVREELGDVLFQIVLHSQLAAEEGRFNLADVAREQADKLRRRHPHVFGGTRINSSAEVVAQWEIQKAREHSTTRIMEIPAALPALQRATKIGHKAQKMDFDWTEAKAVFTKVKEELAEFEEAWGQQTPKDSDGPSEEMREEFGDLLFSLAQVARHLHFDPEASLRAANEKFVKRFRKMIEVSCGEDPFLALPRDQKEKLWQQIKQTQPQKIAKKFPKI